MSWESISQDDVLQPGDIVRLHFNSPQSLWFKATMATLIERALGNKKGYRIISIDYQPAGKIIFKMQILQTNPTLITAGLIVVAILAVAGVAWLTFDKAEKFVKAAVPFTAIVAVIVGLIIFAKRK